MSDKLKYIPFFLALTAVFFVLHGVLENFGFVSFKDASILVLYYLLITIIAGGVFWLLLRNRHRASLVTMAFMSFFFFYSSFIYFINEKYPHSFFSKYTFLLLAFVVIMLSLFIYFKRTKRTFPRLYLFLNVTMIIFVLIDTILLFTKIIYPPVNPLSIYSTEEDEPIPSCASCQKPNVYFLLFDEYASTVSLREQFNYDNSSLDSFLIRQGFHINTHSNSNYSATSFSMASVLNMSYINGIKDPGHLVARDISNSFNLIYNNKVIKLFSSLGYQIKVHSIFDVAGQAAKAKQSFLPINTRLITERTLASRVDQKVGHLLISYFKFKYFLARHYMKYFNGNRNCLQFVKEAVETKSTQPTFLYAHFIMPHFPFLYDSTGRQKTYEEIYKDDGTRGPASYLSYLQYTNKKLEELIAYIREKDPGAVILLCGDHGYRYNIKNESKPFSHFQNLNAVYFPDQNYSKWGDTVSLVNEFRIVFNQLFRHNYPMLKDSTIFLGERKNSQ